MKTLENPLQKPAIQYIIIITILFWSCALFMSLPYLIFLPFFTGVLANFILKKYDFNIKLLYVIICNLLFALFYNHIVSSGQLQQGYLCDMMLYGRMLVNMATNIEIVMFPVIVIPVLGVLGLVLGSMLKDDDKTKKIISLVFVLVFTLNFFICGFGLNFSGFTDAIKTPEAGKYSFDGHIYTRTFYLMKAGASYYDSFYRALTERQGGFAVTSVFNIRPPALFYLWQILPANAIYIALFFSILTALLFFASYFTVEKAINNPLISIITPVILSYLFIYAICANWYSFSEYWAWFFIGAALWAKRYDKKIAWILLFTAGIMLRDIFIYILFVFFAVSIIRKNKEDIKSFSIISLVTAVYYGLHYFYASLGLNLANPGHGSYLSVQQWMHGDLMFAKNSFLFGSSGVFLPAFFIGLIFIVSVIGAINIIKNKLEFYYPLVFIPLIEIVFFFIGLSAVPYWGLIYLPCFAYLVPFTFSGEEQAA